MHNPRYTAYAKANGNDPEQQLRIDEETYPGGKMVGFILWIRERKRAFLEAHPEAFMNDCVTNKPCLDMMWNTDAWDNWLVESANG